MMADHYECFEGNHARLIVDKEYDSDQLDYRLAEEYGIELIALHRLSLTEVEDAGRPAITSV